MNCPGTLPRVTRPAQRRVPQQSRSRDRVERLLDTAAQRSSSRRASTPSAPGTSPRPPGVPVASLYQYFADKDDILLALVERDIEEMDARVAAGVGGPRPALVWSRIVATTMAAFVAVYRERPAFVDDLAARPRQPVDARLRPRAQPARRRRAARLRARSSGCSPPRTPGPRRRDRRRDRRPPLPARLRELPRRRPEVLARGRQACRRRLPASSTPPHAGTHGVPTQ